MTHAVQVRNLRKSYGKNEALRGVDQPVEVVFHFQIDEDVRVLFEIHRLHFQRLRPQRLDPRQNIRQLPDLFPDGGGLLRQDFRHLGRAVQVVLMQLACACEKSQTNFHLYNQQKSSCS